MDWTFLRRPLNEDDIPRQAIKSVAAKFRERNHKPSKQHMYGLFQVARAIHLMACRAHEYPNVDKIYPEAAQSFYVSFLPCGMGKTTTLVETVKALLTYPEYVLDGHSISYKHVGVVIFLQKLDEIEKLVAEMDLKEDEYAIYTSDIALNSKGNQSHDKARVLFTTQKMLERRVLENQGGRMFQELREFYYSGKPRQVRIWDEAIVPSRIMTLVLRDLMGTPKYLQRYYPEFANEIQKLCTFLSGRANGEIIAIPNFSEFNITLEQALDVFPNEDFDECIEALFHLRGLNARVLKDKLFGETSLQYADILPEDLAPMLILDASGQNRATYEYWRRERKDLRFLFSPNKSYGGLTVHHWNKGSGRNALNKDNREYEDIASSVAKVIDEIPTGQKVLVVNRKPDTWLVDLEDEIRKRIKNQPADDCLKFINWGRHTATNDFCDFQHVILAGLLYYPEAAYEAQGLAAKKQKTEMPLTKTELREIRTGEIAHHILQATCRGKVRQAEGDKCPEGCHLYIIYSNKFVRDDELMKKVFPGCKYEKWHPIGFTLSGKVQRKVADDLIGLGDFGEIQVRSFCRKHGIQKTRDLKNMIGESVGPYLHTNKGLIVSMDDKYIRTRFEGGIFKPF